MPVVIKAYNETDSTAINFVNSNNSRNIYSKVSYIYLIFILPLLVLFFSLAISWDLTIGR